MTALVLHCLHGTFQHPGVWSGLEGRLAARLHVPVRVVPESLEPPTSGGLEEWARCFCVRVTQDQPPDGTTRSRVLLGYSLGGRLAMHALLACPDIWTAAVLIAAHPGDSDPEERAEVRERDGAWAARCRGPEPWDRLLAAWDASPVFGGHPNRAPRSPEDLDRERCARSFQAFSRARQANLRTALAAAASPPVLFLTGVDDPRYPALGAELDAAIPRLQHETIVGAGHRVPWDRPTQFAECVARFLNAVVAPTDGDGGTRPRPRCE